MSLTFTDCAQELGVDWHDVRVTRRVYRDGNSEYLLNKTVCRLKDIHALFADTGVGRSAYSITQEGEETIAGGSVVVWHPLRLHLDRHLTPPPIR